MTAAPQDDFDLPRLLRSARSYRRRYGSPVPPNVERLDAAVARRRNRIEWLRARIDEMGAEADRLEVEALGLEKGLAALLDDEITRLREDHQETWSPFPVLGYRLWGIGASTLEGARVPWPRPSLTARCARRDDDEVPHSDGGCPTPACGIYATKQLRPLLESYLAWRRDHGFVAGLVELTGKVVEHDDGYRAAQARAVAVAAVTKGAVVLANDPRAIEALFEDPHGYLDHAPLAPPGPASPEEIVLRFLDGVAQSRGGDPWTSASNAG